MHSSELIMDGTPVYSSSNPDATDKVHESLSYDIGPLPSSSAPRKVEISGHVSHRLYRPTEIQGNRSHSDIESHFSGSSLQSSRTRRTVESCIKKVAAHYVSKRPKRHSNGSRGSDGVESTLSAASGVSINTQRTLDSYLKKVATHHVDPAGDWSFARKKLCYLTQSKPYELLSVLVILLNVITSLHTTDLRARAEELPFVFELSPFVFFAFYGIDFLMRLYVTRTEYTEDPMNIFDAAIVLLDLVSLVFQGIFGDMPFLSVLRGLRMMKIFRIIRNLRQFRELYLMLQGIGASVKPVLFGSLLIAVDLIMWSILAVELLHPKISEMAEDGMFVGCTSCSHAFGSVGDAMLTFVSSIIGGDSWGRIAEPMIKRYPWTALIFIPALFSVQLGLLNVIAAVLVDKQTQARICDEQLLLQLKQELKSAEYHRLGKIFEEMDVDSSGYLSEGELTHAYNTHAAFKYIMDLVDITEDDLSMVFEMMDADDSGQVDYSEFVDKLHYLETMNQRTLLVFMRHLQSRSMEQLRLQGEQLALVEAESRKTTEKLHDISLSVKNLHHIDNLFSPLLSSGAQKMISEKEQCFPPMDTQASRSWFESCIKDDNTDSVTRSQGVQKLSGVFQAPPPFSEIDVRGFALTLEKQFEILSTNLETHVNVVKGELLRLVCPSLMSI